MGLLDVFGTTPIAPALRQAPQQLPPLAPEDERSLLQKIGEPLLGGLGWLGGMLDKYTGARALRGVLGGKPEELASILPFSDAFGLTNPANTVHGTDLLGLDKDTELLSPGGIAGMGLEMLLSPLPGFGSNALTKFGKAAQKLRLPGGGAVLPGNIGPNTAATIAKAGPEAAATARIQGLTGQAVADAEAAANAMANSSRLGGLAQGPQAQELATAMGLNAADVAGKRLGGHMSLRFPFQAEPWTFDLGPLGRAAGALGAGSYNPLGHAARWIGNAAEKLNTNVLKPLFDPTVHGLTDPRAQELAQNVLTPRVKALTEQSREVLGPVEQAIAEQAFQKAQLPGQILNALGLAPPNPVPWGAKQHLDEISQLGGLSLRTAGELGGGTAEQLALLKPQKDLLENLRAMKEATGQEARALQDIVHGGPVAQSLGAVGQPLEYLPRSAEIPVRRATESRSSFKPSVQKAREDISRGLSAADVEHLRTRPDSPSADQIALEYLGTTPQQRTALKQQLAAAQAAANPNQQLIDRLSAEVTSHEDRVLQSIELAKRKGNNAITKYSSSVVDDVARQAEREAMRIGKGEAVLDGLQRYAEPLDQIKGRGVSLSEVLAEANLDKTGLGADKLIDALQRKGFPVANAGDLKKYGVDDRLAGQLTKFIRETVSAPGFVSENITPFIDSFTNLWKTAATVLWPANHMRNQLQAVAQNAVVGATDPLSKGAAAFTRPWTTFRELLQDGKALPDDMAKRLYGAGVSGEEAAKRLWREVQVKDVFGNMGGKAMRDVSGGLGDIAGGAQINPLADVFGPRPGIASLAGQAIDPALYKEAGVHGTLLGAQGVAGYTQNVSPLAKAGRDVAGRLDDMNRGSVYLAKRLQGFSPEAALQEVHRAHYNFANMTPFERDFLRRVIPFYAWSKQSIPAVAKELATNPGGLTGQMVRATGQAGTNTGFLPPWLQESIPVGPKDDQGHQTYLSQLGLGFEDLGKLMANPLKETLGQINPLAKIGLEQATGRQLFSGRDLRDLHSRTADITGLTPPPVVEQLILNSPLGRAFNYAGAAFDPRTSWADLISRLGTGVRLQDVNVPQVEGSGLRARVQDMLHDYPQLRQFSTVYVPPGVDVMSLPPQARELLQLQKLMESRKRHGQPVLP